VPASLPAVDDGHPAIVRGGVRFPHFYGANAMPSDAFMEVSSLSITGESRDKAWGKDSPYGMFEITNFAIDVGEATAGKKKKDKNKPKKKGSDDDDDDSDDVDDDSGRKFTIQKSIDYASPDLFRRCCENHHDKTEGIIAWAMIFFREAGDISKNPYLTIEFRKLQVISFAWDLDPAEGGEAAGKVEKIGFKFETILINYTPQMSTGAHDVTVHGMWNFAENSVQVEPISDHEPRDEST
jgi:type VI protein secretion system component Hcp